MEYIRVIASAILIVLLFEREVDCSRHRIKICKNSKDLPYDESMNLIFYSVNESWIDKKFRSPTEKTTYNREESACPNSLSAIEPPAVKRTCPHYTVLNYDPNREPSVVFEAGCKCDSCLSETGTTDGLCKPVNYFRHVLQKSENTEENCYVRRIMTVSVGCQCVGPIIKDTEKPEE